MKTISQHELHPDAEQLNAFAEQALGGAERDEVFRHLAVCECCRQVVALARDAAVAEVAAEAAAPEPRRVIHANAWWKQWRLVWVPTAIVAAFAVTSIAFYLRQAEQRETAIGMARLTPDQGAEPASAPPPPVDQLKALPPAAPAQATPASKAAGANPARPDRGAGERQKPAPVIADKLSSPPRPLPPFPPPAPLPPPQQSPMAGLAGSGFMAGNRPDFSQPSASAQLQAEKKEQDEQPAARVLHGALFAAKALPPTAEHGEQRNATEQVTVSAEQPEMRLAPIPHFETLESASANSLAADAIKPIRLPSALPAISVAAAGKVSLAIDQAGTLFISTDQGGTWDRVLQQWTGRAVLVRKQTAPPAEASQLPDAKKRVEAPAAASAPSRPAAIFEIVNDQSEIWSSADGRIWTAK